MYPIYYLSQLVKKIVDHQKKVGQKKFSIQQLCVLRNRFWESDRRWGIKKFQTLNGSWYVMGKSLILFSRNGKAPFFFSENFFVQRGMMEMAKHILNGLEILQ